MWLLPRKATLGSHLPLPPSWLLDCVFTSVRRFQTASSASSSAPEGISHSTSYTLASCQTPQTCSCGGETNGKLGVEVCLSNVCSSTGYRKIILNRCFLFILYLLGNYLFLDYLHIIFGVFSDLRNCIFYYKISTTAQPTWPPCSSFFNPPKIL